MPLTVKSIQDQQVQIDSLADQLNALNTASDEGQISQLAKWNYQTWTFIGEVAFDAKAKFTAAVEFVGSVAFKAPAKFFDRVTFAGRVTFEDKDIAGVTQVPAGATSAVVTFERPLENVPVVTVTPQNQVVAVAVEQVTKTGFTIKVLAPLSENLNVSWIALPVSAVHTPTVLGAEVTASPSSTPMPTASPAPSVDPSPTGSPAVSPTPTASPVPSVTPSASPEPIVSPSVTPSSTPSATPNP